MNDIEQKLNDSGYKLSKPRQLVLNILSDLNKPESAHDIYIRLEKKIHLVSVYRALNLFETLSFVNIETINKEKFYCLADHAHHHIICRKCGCIEEFACSKEEFRDFKNFSDINHHLTLTGICNECKNKLYERNN